MCYFLHQSESKEIDEMKRIAVVVMRKDRELKNLKKIIYIVLLTDNNQNEMGPTIWLRLFPKRAFRILHMMHAFALFKFFCKIKMLTGWWILMIIWWPHYNCALTRMLWMWLMIQSIFTFDISVIFHTITWLDVDINFVCCNNIILAIYKLSLINFR